jgi:hypothetical protein
MSFDKTLLFAIVIDVTFVTYTIDISSPSKCYLVGSLIDDNIANFITTSKNNEYLFWSCYDKLTVIDLKAQYALHSNFNTAKLGVKTTFNFSISVLKNSEYIFISQKYRYIKFSLFTINPDPISSQPVPTYSEFPGWIYPNTGRGNLEFSPTSASQIGTYNILV